MRDGRIAIVTLGAALACDPGSMFASPTPPNTVAETTAEPTPTNPPAKPEPAPPADPASFQTVINPFSDTEGMIYHAKIGCIVYPPDGKERPPGVMPPPKDVECPPIMRDSVWGECVGGTVMANEAKTACVCEMGGNPPPPVQAMTRCPTHG